MKIYLIRHGQTDWNVQGRFQGREDIPLNENGMEQAKICGEVLQGTQFQAIISSPLKRASKTAQIIGKYVSVDQIITDEGITERDFSKVSGMTAQERDAFYASGEQDDKEPWDDLCARMFATMKTYAEQYPNQNIIMISHGASINSVLSVLSQGKTGTGKIFLKNTCINIIDYNNDEFKIEACNLSADEYLTMKKQHSKS